MAKRRRSNSMGSMMGDTLMPVIGSGVIGTIGTATGASPAVTGLGQTGMQLLAVGNVAKIGMSIPSMMGGKKRRRTTIW